MKIYHNPRCRKSRETLELITNKGIDHEVILYLETPPTKKELKDIIKMLGIDPTDLLRKTEPIYKEKFKGKELSSTKWIDAMIKFPKLIERPIVVKGKKAIIGRPPENVKSLF